MEKFGLLIIILAAVVGAVNTGLFVKDSGYSDGDHQWNSMIAFSVILGILALIAIWVFLKIDKNEESYGWHIIILVLLLVQVGFIVWELDGEDDQILRFSLVVANIFVIVLAMVRLSWILWWRQGNTRVIKQKVIDYKRVQQIKDNYATQRRKDIAQNTQYKNEAYEARDLYNQARESYNKPSNNSKPKQGWGTSKPRPPPAIPVAPSKPSVKKSSKKYKPPTGQSRTTSALRSRKKRQSNTRNSYSAGRIPNSQPLNLDNPNLPSGDDDTDNDNFTDIFMAEPGFGEFENDPNFNASSSEYLVDNRL